jgi:topoisomerase IA-like protein
MKAGDKAGGLSGDFGGWDPTKTSAKKTTSKKATAKKASARKTTAKKR